MVTIFYLSLLNNSISPTFNTKSCLGASLKPTSPPKTVSTVSLASLDVIQMQVLRLKKKARQRLI